MVVMVYVGCHSTLAVTCLVLGMGLNCIAAGHFVSAVDLAPNYAGTLLGVCRGSIVPWIQVIELPVQVTNTFSGGVVGSLAPLATGTILKSLEGEWGAWEAVFWIAAVIYIVGNLVYVLTIQAEPQPWNEIKSETENGKHGEHSNTQ